MARIRTVKPNHWIDRELPNISLQAHLLWIATWNFSDDDGVFEADPLLIKSQAFPRRQDIRTDEIKKWLDQLVKARFLIPFQYNGEGYYVSRTFKAHQKIDRPQKGIIPENELIKILSEHSTNDRRTLVPVGEGSVEESKVVDMYAAYAPHTKIQVDAYLKFNEWLSRFGPRILKMDRPFTIAEYLHIKDEFTSDEVKSLVTAMENRKDLLKKNTSAYLTFLSWSKRQFKTEETERHQKLTEADKKALAAKEEFKKNFHERNDTETAA